MMALGAACRKTDRGGWSMKHKLAQARYPVHDFIRQRWSPRAFSDRKFTPPDLCRLLEAARWAPSSANEQPWSFLVATKDDQTEFEKLFSCLVPGNQRWAGAAPVLMLSISHLLFEEDKSPNRHAFHDVGLAVENLILQAMSMELFVHQMAGFDVEKAKTLFGIPEGHEPVAMIAVGYLGDADTLPDKLREREMAARSRKPLEEFVFTGRWGQTSSIVSA
jgi:nitroreductase